MTKGRMEAFSDGVIAVIITIMVLELKVPAGSEPSSLLPLTPVFFSYVLSFVFVGIYWNNHHHLLQTAQHVNGRILWANLHLLFWMSLVPFVTAWMGNNNFAPFPVALYGLDLLLAGFAYWLLAQSLIALHGKDSQVAVALGNDVKGLLSITMYGVAIPLAYINPWYSCTLYGLVALIWLIPDTRIEKTFYRASTMGSE